MVNAKSSALQDPYGTLGLPRSATTADIKRAYYVLSRKVHPDKDRRTPTAIATARFQNVKAAYELLSDASRRRAFDTTVITAKPCRPASTSQKATHKPVAKKRPRATGIASSGSGAEKPTSSKKSSDVDTEARPSKPRKPSTFEVLDSSEEEAAREDERQAAEALRFAQKRVRMRRAAEQAERIKQREAERNDPDHKKTSGNPGYLRLSLKRSSKFGQAADISAESLATAFKQFEARVVMMQNDVVVLAVGSEALAVTCALSFHNWTKRRVSEAEEEALKAIRIIVAPVAATGRALSGTQETIAVTRLQVAACDQRGSKFA